MGHHYEPHTISAEEYSKSMFCLGPISPPNRAYDYEINGTPNTSFQRWGATPVSTYQMPSPSLTTTTSISGEQMTLENELIPDAKVSHILPYYTVNGSINVLLIDHEYEKERVDLQRMQ